MVCTQAELTEQRNAAEAEIDLLEKRREEAVQACMRVQSELREAKDNKEYHQASTAFNSSCPPINLAIAAGMFVDNS